MDEGRTDWPATEHGKSTLRKTSNSSLTTTDHEELSIIYDQFKVVENGTSTPPLSDQEDMLA